VVQNYAAGRLLKAVRVTIY